MRQVLEGVSQDTQLLPDIVQRQGHRECVPGMVSRVGEL